MNYDEKIILKKVQLPYTFNDVEPVYLTEATMEQRAKKVLDLMKEDNFDSLVIYADKEHGSNFEYLTGFIPRFEEGLFVLKKTGQASFILGNENLKMSKYARLQGELYHYPLFSLPNQPMENEKSLDSILSDIDFSNDKKIGLIGWKMFTSTQYDNSAIFDIPHFIVEAVRNICTIEAEIVNAAYLFIGGGKGARTINNANEIAHYEYGANLSSTSMLKAMNAVEIGVKESYLGNLLNAEGQTNNVVTIAATGVRFEKANLYPTSKQLKLGDTLSLTTGYKGGLSSRAGFVVESAEQLPDNQRDYLEKVAIPYFKTVVFWLENIRIGMYGGEFYKMIEEVYPKEKYHWHLNPGHLVADEEWMSSPIYPSSKETLKSGMVFQIDIIPFITGYGGVSAEECIALADEELRNQINNEYPHLWGRIEKRRYYIQHELGINLPEHVIPLSNLVAYLRPFFLNKSATLTCVK
ncbi:M24 family metallopeptidase [Niallia circulans]|uniref:M24 family metallopeptidase n=1 Tax=Niallia circulans TaxID=1397 RepID=A0A941GFZ7_NIACI|nr:aminopeptidase P family protein [Niallia circulans]MCB5239577.1 M24 family metallopeptidase [Niallia circulans]